MPKRYIGTEILEAIREIKARKAGKVARTHDLCEPEAPQIIRSILGF